MKLLLLQILFYVDPGLISKLILVYKIIVDIVTYGATITAKEDQTQANSRRRYKITF